MDSTCAVAGGSRMEAHGVCVRSCWAGVIAVVYLSGFLILGGCCVVDWVGIA